MHILLVEDEAVFVKPIQMHLTKLGHTVTHAEHGEHGWELFSQASDSFDVVLTDVKMPVTDGMSLLERIRREEFDVPVIVMTAHGDLDVAVQALRLGAFDFLAKPFHMTQLVQTLEKLRELQHPIEKLADDLPLMEETVQLSLSSRLSMVESALVLLQNALQPLYQMRRCDASKVRLCLGEALNNAIVHGNLEVPSSIRETSWEDYQALITEREKIPQYGDRRVKLEYQLANGIMTFTIQDEGSGFDHQNLPDPNDPMNLLSSGRGLLLIRLFMDDVEWNESGNHIRMVKVLRSLN